MIEQGFEGFNWEKYENWNGEGLRANKKVKVEDLKTKVYSHEPYAQEMFDLYNNQSPKFVRKDLEKGDIVTIVEIPSIEESGKMVIEILGGLSIEVDLGREKRFIQLFGFSTIQEFAQALKTKEQREKFIEQGLYAYVIESSPSTKISLWQGHLKKVKDEFMAEINSPSKAYVCKVIEANRGGFFVEVQGVDAFMPGSLAAPNKIVDFQSYVGKEIIVMIEDYLQDMNSFIVSHKKYIDHILPKKISELSLLEKYQGSITGASKYGVFVEFNEIFTGLLHKSKMTPETYSKFRNREYSPGDVIEFYIGEITKDNRIILTEESPEEKKRKIEEFLKEYENKPAEGEVAAIMTFGIIVTVGELSGIVPNKEFRKAHSSPKNFIQGDIMKLKLLEIRDGDKLVFTFWLDEKKEDETKEEGA
jgi:predicted RNA-binding protein with RPS1 domain